MTRKDIILKSISKCSAAAEAINDLEREFERKKKELVTKYNRYRKQQERIQKRFEINDKEMIETSRLARAPASTNSAGFSVI